MLGLPLAAVYTEVTRRLIRSVQYAEDKATARRSAAIAAAKLVVRNLSWLIGEALFAETIFNFHGLGQLMVVAANQRDPAFAQAILLTATIVAVALSLVVDLVVGAFVPGWRAVER